MKAISILQPWAQLVVTGEKKIETRSWKTGHRGWLAIHVSQRFRDSQRELASQEPFRGALGRHGFKSASALPRGVIVGLVKLTDCVPTEQLTDVGSSELAFGIFTPGHWAWLLDEPRPLEIPVSFPGSLGIFDIPDALFDASLQRLSAEQALVSP